MHDSIPFKGEYVLMNQERPPEFHRIDGLPLESIIGSLAQKYCDIIELFPLYENGEVKLNLGAYLERNSGRYIVVLYRGAYPTTTAELLDFLNQGIENLNLCSEFFTDNSWSLARKSLISLIGEA